MIRFKNRATESAHNSSPRFPVERNMTEPGGGLHIGDACSAAASRAKSGRRFAPPHLTSLIYQKAKAHHCFSFDFEIISATELEISDGGGEKGRD